MGCYGVVSRPGLRHKLLADLGFEVRSFVGKDKSMRDNESIDWSLMIGSANADAHDKQLTFYISTVKTHSRKWGHA